MEDSILLTIKKLLGLEADYTPFDTDIIVHINSAMMVLRQLGVGPTSGFAISDENTTWDDYLSDSQMLESVKSYIYLKVKMLFDPPASSSVLDAMKAMIAEYEWRLNVEVDGGDNV